MPPRKRFDKKNAQTFLVVHRAHDDSLYFDNDASTHVLVPADKRTKALTTADVAPREGNVRDNEGEAAQYGIFYDDSRYDYMQHLRPMGGADGIYIGADSDTPRSKQPIELLFRDQLPLETSETRKAALERLESIPQELRGFQPDMDPRLREVMEALEDEAYVDNNVDDDQEDIFTSLLLSGVQDQGAEEEDYDEWDVDNYSDHSSQYEGYDEAEFKEPGIAGEPPHNPVVDSVAELEDAIPDLPEEVRTEWERDFHKFKHQNRNAQNEWDSDNEFDEEDLEAGEEEDDVTDLPNIKKKAGKLRKKKGALTDTSSFSMLSSANYRTAGLALLDDRYEQYAKLYEEEEEPEESPDYSQLTQRTDFEELLDDFLDNYELESGGRKIAKKSEDRARLQQAADSVSRGKLAARRKKERERGSGQVTNSFLQMSLN